MYDGINGRKTKKTEEVLPIDILGVAQGTIAKLLYEEKRLVDC
jgi:hypothetical protein